jgi:gamma-glutamylcyclotransferase (GGCT)/AIG2-like uncharacterized protein YtfP
MRGANPTIDLFVYGTLMDEELVVQLTGRSFGRVPARLPGYRRIEPPGSYAYIVPDPRGDVVGLLLQGLDQEAMRALDAYEDEGRLYQRTAVDVLIGDERCRALTYVGVMPAVRDVRMA